MPTSHIIYALIIAAIWGNNFIAIKCSYTSFHPFSLLALRFILTLFPAIFFVKRPNCSWKFLISFATFQWIGQFGFCFVAVYMGMPAGLAALLMQIQAAFTMVLSMVFWRYRPHSSEIVGLLIALCGIFIIGSQFNTQQGVLSFIFIMSSALCVSIGSMHFKNRKNLDMIGVVIWSSLIPPVPYLLLSFYFEGGIQGVINDVMHINWISGLSLLYTTYFSTIVATSLWVFLLRQHEPAHVVPYGLLIPVFAITSGYFILDEEFTPLTMSASALVFFGLLINQFYKRIFIKKILNSDKILK